MNSILQNLARGSRVVVARPFGTPLVLEGWAWLPVNELIAWLGMSIWTGKAGRPWGQRLLLGALKMTVMLGSEWCHNLAHAAAARAIGKPMDELRVYAGMPRVVYNELNDLSVTPGQHILRALGGPIFNLGLWGIFSLLRRLARPDSAGRELLDLAAGTNAFLGLGGALLPIPGLDGGAILKWALVKGGQSPAQADWSVQRLNAPLAPVMGAAALLAWRRQRWLGIFLGAVGISAALIASGKVKE